MRLRSLFAVGALTLTLGAMAAITTTLPSQTWAVPAGVVAVDLTTAINFAFADLSPDYWGEARVNSMAVTFTIDTSLIDVQFTNSSGNFLASSVTTKSLTAGTPATAWARYLLTGSGGATMSTPSGSLRTFQFTASDSSGGLVPAANLFANKSVAAGNIKLLVNTAAIAALPSHSYSITYSVAVNDNFVSPNSVDKQYSTRVGGDFTVVPEPSAIIALVTGLGSLLALRRKA